MSQLMQFYPLPIVDYPLPIVDYPLPILDYPLPILDCYTSLPHFGRGNPAPTHSLTLNSQLSTLNS